MERFISLVKFTFNYQVLARRGQKFHFETQQQLQCGGKTVCMQSLKETVSGIAELLPHRV